jgi:hypothetical protein
MTRIVGIGVSKGITSFAACILALLLPNCVHAQLFTFPKPDLIDYTAQNPFDRLPDGRPKVPDNLIERARGLSSEEIWACSSRRSSTTSMPTDSWSFTPEFSLCSSCPCAATLTR